MKIGQPPHGSLPLATSGEYIAIHVAELKQSFNSMDPSPFKERNLDPYAEDFIVSWASEVPRGALVTLIVHVDRIAEAVDTGALRSAINQFFRYRAEMTRRRLRDCLRRQPRKWRWAFCPTGRVSSIRGSWASSWSSHAAAPRSQSAVPEGFSRSSSWCQPSRHAPQ